MKWINRNKEQREQESEAPPNLEEPDSLISDDVNDAMDAMDAMDAIDIENLQLTIPEELFDEVKQEEENDRLEQPSEHTLPDEDENTEQEELFETDFWRYVDRKPRFKKKEKKRKGLVILAVVLFLLGGTATFFVATPVGRHLIVSLFVNLFYDEMNVVPSEKETKVPSEKNGIPTPTPIHTVIPVLSPTVSQAPDDDTVVEDAPRHEEHVYNILLIGVESLDENGKPSKATGRSDTVILASINLSERKIKLTSFLRDIWVQIPGYEDAKLNAAYARGGAELLVDTMEVNFKVDIDCYAMVNFEDFEGIIDQLGGVDISLTEEEAEYLNTTNYISDKSQRTVEGGYQTLTGNQTLGYCRIRNVVTATGASADFGRTERQRNVLKAVFNKYKQKSLAELLTLMNACASMVTTDVSKDDMVSWLTSIIEERIYTLETLRIPSAGTFQGVTIQGAEAISIMFDDNIELLQEFIFGDTK